MAREFCRGSRAMPLQRRPLLRQGTNAVNVRGPRLYPLSSPELASTDYLQRAIRTFWFCRIFVIFFYLAKPDTAAALRGQSICSENRRCTIPLANVFNFCNPCVISTIMPCHDAAKPDEPEVQGP